jgi:hypothetical protein
VRRTTAYGSRLALMAGDAGLLRRGGSGRILLLGAMPACGRKLPTFGRRRAPGFALTRVGGRPRLAVYGSWSTVHGVRFTNYGARFTVIGRGIRVKRKRLPSSTALIGDCL